MPKWLDNLRWKRTLRTVIAQAQESGAEVRSFDKPAIPKGAPEPARIADDPRIDLLDALVEEALDEDGCVTPAFVVEQGWAVAVLPNDDAEESEWRGLAQWLEGNGRASVSVVLTEGISSMNPRRAAQARRDNWFWQTGASEKELRGIPLIEDLLGGYIVTTDDRAFVFAMTPHDYHVIAGPLDLVREMAGCEPAEAMGRMRDIAAKDDWYEHVADVVRQFESASG